MTDEKKEFLWVAYQVDMTGVLMADMTVNYMAVELVEWKADLREST